MTKANPQRSLAAAAAGNGDHKAASSPAWSNPGGLGARAMRTQDLLASGLAPRRCRRAFDDGVSPSAACRRRIRRHRHCHTPLAPTGRCSRLRTADGGRHPLTRQRSPISAIAGAGRRASGVRDGGLNSSVAVAERALCLKPRLAIRRGVSLFLPIWHTDRGRRNFDSAMPPGESCFHKAIRNPRAAASLV
jgi:hypothetical protein